MRVLLASIFIGASTFLLKRTPPSAFHLFVLFLTFFFFCLLCFAKPLCMCTRLTVCVVPSYIYKYIYIYIYIHILHIYMYICNSLVFALSRHNCEKKKGSYTESRSSSRHIFLLLSRFSLLSLEAVSHDFDALFFSPFNLLSLVRPSLLGCFTSLLPFPLFFVSAVLKSLLEVKNDLLILLYK